MSAGNGCCGGMSQPVRGAPQPIIQPCPLITIGRSVPAAHDGRCEPQGQFGIARKIGAAPLDLAGDLPAQSGLNESGRFK